MLNVRDTVTKRQPHSEEPVFTLGDWRVYEHANTCPRACVVHQVDHAPAIEDLYARINNERFNPLQQAVVTEDLEIPPQAGNGSSKNQVEITTYRPGRIEIDVSAVKPGLLILSESFYPGWEVSVDGGSTVLHCANGALMGVVVPAGESKVSLRYSPRSVILGAWVTALTLGVLLVALVVSRRSLPRTA